MMKKRIISILLTACMAVSLAACGDETAVVTDDKNAVELVEPVNAESGTETVACRNMYNTTTYPAYALPYVEEYAFADNVTFKSYGAFPGEEAKKGDVLLYSDTTNLDNEIEKKEEALKNKVEQHAEQVENLNKNIEDTYAALTTAKIYLDEYTKAKGNLEREDKEDTSEYTFVMRQYNNYTGQVRHYEHQWNMAKIALEQSEELYDLEYAYESKQLKKLKSQSRESRLVSGIDGYVVSLASMNQGSQINKGVPVVAIGDTSKKIVKCDYINKAVAEKAEDMYAFVNGKRYEAAYQPMDTEEYNRLSAQGEKIYSTFIISDEKDEIKTGDFVVITVVNTAKEDVLSISKSAIRKDEGGAYVYVYKDREAIHTRIETGFSDGTYTEILDGLKDGDVILSEDAHKPALGRDKLTKGSFSTKTEVSGSLGYPSNTVLRNEIEYGTAYFVEYNVENYDIVSKGEVLATVRVEKDAITLSRYEKQLQRAKERLDDILNDDVEDDEEVIAQRRESIADIEETIAQIKTDFATTQIKADRDGVIVAMMNFEAEDIVQRNQVLFYIADENTCYIEGTNENQLLNFGNDVTISYESFGNNAFGNNAFGNNFEPQTVTVPGKVANISQLGLSSALHTEYVMISVPPEYISDMAGSLWGDMGGWWNRNRFTVSATVREMNNVVLVPKEAVWSVNGNTYVDVVDKNGKVVTTSFVAGGFDTANYWVIEGLEEGTEICLE
ncbi:MAG: hypothetical protein IKL04_06735 [Lachnospiraceae bacterium]|nr:hypothetical protein [Lachnospiraceae bacterium]